MRSNFRKSDQKPARCLRHRFDQQDARHQRVAGEVPLEDRIGLRDLCFNRNGSFADVEVGDPVDQFKIFEVHGWARQAPLPRPVRRCGR